MATTAHRSPAPAERPRTPRAPLPGPSRPRAAHVREALAQTFWVGVISLVSMYAFFLVIGAFTPAGVLPLTVTVAALVVLWSVHAWRHHRLSRDAGPDPRLNAVRERRGF
jgi:hypothetical protein